MLLTLELTLLLLLILGLGVWGIVSGLRQSRTRERVLVTPQDLSALAQPYRRLMGEAVNVAQDVHKQAASAPKTLQRELGGLAARVDTLVERALPRARHGTSLAAYLLELSPEEDQHVQTTAAAQSVEAELEAFVTTLKTMRGKVYQVLTDATRLDADTYLGRDLDDALIEIEALEEAFSDLKLEA